MSLLIITALVTGIILMRTTAGFQRFQDMCADLKCLGPWAPLGFIGVYVIAVILAIPGSALTALAGVLFGSIWGVVYVSVASTLGATLAFLIARYLARDLIYSKLAKRESFRKLDEMSEKHGVWIVAIVRLVPVFPFNLVNYGLGLTRIGFFNYVFFSWLFMLPGTFLYVVGGDTLKRAFTEGSVPWKPFFLALLVGIVLYIAARKNRGKFR